MSARNLEGEAFFPPDEIEQYIDQFLTAVCDTSRRRILALLSNSASDTTQPLECSVGEIAQHLGLAFSTTSEHLKQLLQLHMVLGRREGKKTYYRIRNKELVQAFHDMLAALESHYHYHILPKSSNETP